MGQKFHFLSGSGGQGGQNSSQNPWAISVFLWQALKLAWVSFETSMDHIQNWLTELDFWHGPKNKTLG